MSEKAPPVRRFTYGDQFEQEKTPLRAILALIVEYVDDREALQEAMRTTYFPGHGSAANSQKMAKNCVLSLNAYRLVSLTDKGKKYKVTSLTTELITLSDDREFFGRFATHIISELDGLLLLRIVENIRARGEHVTLEYIGEELNDMGVQIAPNCTYISTMRSWLARADIFRATGWEINWDVVYGLLHMDADSINRLYGLSPEQKYFLLSLVSLNPEGFLASNKVANHARSVYSVRMTTKDLVKDVLEPLEQRGFIFTQKSTKGRGAKPHDVKLTHQTRNDLLKPLLEGLAKTTELASAELNKTFKSVVEELEHNDKNVRGKALELFAVWIVRLLGLRFSKWRLRHFQSTGNAEVDVIAASDKIVYNRWQIQCKNINRTSKVNLDTVAKEVGLTFLTKADVVMMVTTGNYTSDAVNYANQVMETTRYYIILLDGNDISRIIEDTSCIIDILNVKARRVFAKRELGISDPTGYDPDHGGDEIAENLAEDAEEKTTDE